MRQRTRGELLARVKLFQQSAQQDESLDVTTRQFLDYALGRVASFLGASSVGFYQTRRTYTLAAETSLLTLPANFEDLLALRLVAGGQVRPLAYESEAQAARYPDQNTPTGNAWGRQQRWQIEGPGLDYDPLGDVYNKYDQRLRFEPALPASSELRISYVTQPPSLVDVDEFGNSLGTYTDTAQDSTIVVDVISEIIEEGLIGYARVWSAARGDNQDYSKATQQLQNVASEYLQSRAARNGFQADTLDRYRAGQGRNGY